MGTDAATVLDGEATDVLRGRMAKRILTHADLLAHLAEQLGFLNDSSDAFDRGREGEAKRLAVTLRVLLHDTAKSHSLLAQIGRKGGLFWDSAGQDKPGNLLSYGGLVAIRLTSGGQQAPGSAQYVPLLDDVRAATYAPFDRWWNATVFRDRQGTELSRRELVLTAANQDGGAHIDPSLDERYARFLYDNAMGWESSNGQTRTPLDGAVGVAIRQIAHEVLRTLVPGYQKRPSDIVAQATMQSPLAASPGGSVVVPRVERNELCPCRSGKKYKKCHGA